MPEIPQLKQGAVMLFSYADLIGTMFSHNLMALDYNMESWKFKNKPF